MIPTVQNFISSGLFHRLYAECVYSAFIIVAGVMCLFYTDMGLTLAALCPFVLKSSVVFFMLTVHVEGELLV